jgi:hypothetical protein
MNLTTELIWFLIIIFIILIGLAICDSLGFLGGEDERHKRNLQNGITSLVSVISIGYLVVVAFAMPVKVKEQTLNPNTIAYKSNGIMPKEIGKLSEQKTRLALASNPDINVSLKNINSTIDDIEFHGDVTKPLKKATLETKETNTGIIKTSKHILIIETK